MIAKATALLIGCLLAPLALAEGCHILTQSSSPGVAAVETESCYEFQGMPAGTINWSCSNESQETLGTRQEKVAKCDAGYVASCRAAITQETLANHRSSSSNPPANEPNVPDDAKVVTYYYDLDDPTQAKNDCEKGGGTWEQR
ncbi:hypothetical protein [Pseudomonas sp. ML96]|uniref:hypothetical protein n=1 Tax=Pseudomonas sp. ML96 TaxID=1523503 RepID=UPI0005BC7400|nr:hypothetical protein [Pseudomonas sp. ML96]